MPKNILALLCLSTMSLTSCFQQKTQAPLTPSESLGQMLFFDPRLSSDGTISCNSCHNVMQGGDDSRKVSMGVKGALGGRSAGTVFNAVFLSTQFWDGRAKDLAEQAKGPLTNPIEMGNLNHDQVITRLSKIPGYVLAFEQAFGKNSLNIDNLAQAIADYEATLTTLNSPYDLKTMTKEQLKGFQTFQETGCIACHSGEHFAGPELPKGTGFFQKFPTFPNTDYDKKYKFTEDIGRMEVTQKESDKHMFRVPTLRNIALTAPYFHNGAIPTLTEAVKVMAKTQLNKDLSDEKTQEIVNFLEALTGTLPSQTMPTLPATLGRSVAEEAK